MLAVAVCVLANLPLQSFSQPAGAMSASELDKQFLEYV
jgi:hypothetical protein